MSLVLLDTDIGSDVDDALALSVLLGSPEVTLVGVTTVYGDTVLRARLAARLIDLSVSMGSEPIPVVAGVQQALSGRPVWWAGHEGASFDDLERQVISQSRDAPQFMIDTVNANPGAVNIVAIGPLTNLAQALALDSEFASKVGHVYIMGGHFAQPQPAGEHNFRCDVVAAATVLSSGMPMTVTGLDVTTQVSLDLDDVLAIGSAGPLGAALQREIAQWWAFHGHDWNNPHDPITALTLVAPSLFGSQGYRVEVAQDDEHLGESRAKADDASATRVTHDIDVPAVRTEIVKRILTAGNAASQ